jgi:hypothetical protein
LRSDGKLLMNSISSAVSGFARLELDARVQVFGVLADDDDVDAQTSLKKLRTPG